MWVICLLVGTFLVVFGAVINIFGRLYLKGNWANHVKIYEGHKLITGGPYRFVRHPLYSSIIIMLLGGSIAYANWLCVVLILVVFIPSMVYRGKQEEEMLSKEFAEYSTYKQNVGMLFPKSFRRYNK